MLLKRCFSVLALATTALVVATVSGASPASATAPTVIDLVGVSSTFGSNGAGFCAITQTGSNKELHCWGINGSGRFGFGDTNPRSYPTKVAANPASGFTNTNVTDVSIGFQSTCLVESGVVYCAGLGSSGRLGNGANTDSTLFVKVADNSTATPPITNSGFTKVAATNNGGCALKSSMVYCWGADTYGLMADGATTGGSTVPVMVADASPFINGAITEIAMSGKHGCVLRDMGQANDRKIYCWGMTVSSAVGGAPTYNTNNNLLAPTLVPSAGDFTNGNVSTFALGEENTCVVDSGVVRCFGANSGGYSSPGAPPSPVWPPNKIADNAPFTNSGVSKVASGAMSACAIKSGAVYCWGSDVVGMLGDGAGANSVQSAVKVASANGFTNTNVSEVAVSAQTVCALEGGALFCWGSWGTTMGSDILLTANGTKIDSYVPGAVVWPVAPTLTSSPATVDPAGGSLTITGTGFTGTTSVTIDSTTATFSVANDGSITITVPALSAGSYTVSITTPGGVITQSLTIGTAPTTVPTTTAPTTVAPSTSAAPSTSPSSTVASGGASASQFVTTANQSELAQLPGEVKVVQNGVTVTANLRSVPISAAVAAATPPAARTAAQVAEIQSAGASLIATFLASLPQGATSNVGVTNTSTGAVVTGLARDSEGNAVDVPVEEVLLVTTSSSALLFAGVNASSAIANFSASGVLEIGPGGVINVAGSGLPASGVAELVVMSTPRLLKSFSAGSDGTFADRAALPSDLAAGDHTVVLAGSGIYIAVGITVEAPTLPTTGVGSAGTGGTLVFVLFAAVFAAVVLLGRRRLLVVR